jgi:hypothetical protein
VRYNTVVKITEDLIKYATLKSESMGELNNSITNGDGNVAGFIGEILALKALKLNSSNLKSSSSYEYDILDDQNISWDVKTKRRTVKPRPYHNCTVADYNTKQKCDRYLFVSLYNLEEGFILGWISKEDFYKKAKFFKKGEIDPLSPPSKVFRFTADCYNIEAKYLNPV